MSRRLPTAELEPSGLSTEEAGRRLAEVGANEIQRAQRTSRWRLLGRQLASPLIGLLLAAAAVSAFLGEVADAIAIGDDRRAERARRLLPGVPRRERAAGAAIDDRAARPRDARRSSRRDRRRGRGPRRSAGARGGRRRRRRRARCIEAHRCRRTRPPLTGESAPVEKATTPVPADAPLAERLDSRLHGHLGRGRDGPRRGARDRHGDRARAGSRTCWPTADRHRHAAADAAGARRATRC